MEKDVLLIGAEHVALYQDACKESGANIRTADDLKSALDVIQQSTPTLILVDNEVLGKLSIEICQTLKKYPGTAHIPLMFIVPRANVQELLDALFIPVNDYIFLPLDLEDFKLRLSAQFGLAEFKTQKKLISVKEKIEELEKLVEIFPNYNAAWEELAEIYEKTERIEDALHALLKLSKEYYHQNNFGFAMDVITRMKNLLAKQGLKLDNYAQFTESLERCLRCLNVKKEPACNT